jgi:4-hydroxy-tetrahydrodipicolinate synthase
LRFFAAVMERSAVPVATQNAPEYLGIGLAADGIEALRRDHPNFTLLKAEGSGVSIRRLIEASGGRLAVFGGRNGLALPDTLRAGCAGSIPCPETCGPQSRVFELMRRGDPDSEIEAERLYRDILAVLTFVMQSLETLHGYFKRIMARRLGLTRVYDRAPGLQPSDFGLACTQHYVERLDRL